MLKFLAMTAALAPLLVLSACERQEEGMFNIDNDQLQQKLVVAVQDAGINASVDKYGRLRFALDQQTRVEEIAHNVIAQSTHYTNTSFHWPDPQYTDMFMSKLEAEGIEYETETRDGQLIVRLPFESGARWQPIQERINELYYAEAVRGIKVERR